MDKSIERLSSGLRINSAADDAAGMAIAGRMESQQRGLEASIRNAKDGQSMVSTMEGAMQEITEILQRMRELALQASSGVATKTDRGYLDLEMEQLVDEVDAIAANTKFNNQAVLTGAAFSFYSDIDISGTAMSTNTADIDATILGVTDAQVDIDVLNVSIGTQVKSAILMITSAIGQVDNKRAQLGAISNRLDHTIDNLTNVVMNTIASKSRIEDADFAAETTNMTRNSVLQQAATSMLAQANASKNSILSLIQQ
jgi:flagellin